LTTLCYMSPSGSEWREHALLNDAFVPTRKRLFRNDSLATGHPLTRIRVFNSGSEGNEKESDILVQGGGLQERE